MKNDPTIMKSNYIALAETWIPEGNESFDLPGYNFHGASILRSHGEEPTHPKVLLLGPTGKSASLIGK